MFHKSRGSHKKIGSSLQALLCIRRFVTGYHPHAAHVIQSFGSLFIGGFYGRSEQTMLVDRSYELFIVSEVLVVVVSDFPVGLNSANLKIVFSSGDAVLAIAISNRVELLRLLGHVDTAGSCRAAFRQHPDISEGVIQAKQLSSQGTPHLYVSKAHRGAGQNRNTGDDLAAGVLEN